MIDRMKYYFKFLLCFLIISCSSDDDSVTDPIVGGPNEGGDGVDIPDTGDDEEPLTYNASAILKNSANFPIGNIVLNLIFIVFFSITFKAFL